MSKIDVRRIERAGAGLLAAILALSALAAGCRDEKASSRSHPPAQPAPTQAARRAQPAEPPQPQTVTINEHVWHVRLAVTPEQHSVGLAGVTHLGEREGMLFVFYRPEVRRFWMRGCVIPLDVAFISADGRIVRIETMSVEPPGQHPRMYESGEPVLYALETAGGALSRAGVRLGDRAIFRDDLSEAAKEAARSGR